MTPDDFAGHACPQELSRWYENVRLFGSVERPYKARGFWSLCDLEHLVALRLVDRLRGGYVIREDDPDGLSTPDA